MKELTQCRGRRIGPPAEDGQETAAGVNQVLEAMQAAALAGFHFIPVPGKRHVNSRQLIGGWRVDGEEAVAPEGAKVVQRSLAGEAHHEIGGGDVALETDELDAAAPKRGERKANLVHEGSVVAVERRFHALDRAGGGCPERFFEGSGIVARTQRSVSRRTAGHQISVKVMSTGHE